MNHSIGWFQAAAIVAARSWASKRAVNRAFGTPTVHTRSDVARIEVAVEAYRRQVLPP